MAQGYELAVGSLVFLIVRRIEVGYPPGQKSLRQTANLSEGIYLSGS